MERYDVAVVGGGLLGLATADHLASTLGFGGFWRMAGRHWRTGLEEITLDLSRRAFLRACRRYLPDLRAEHLAPGPFGVRAQAVNPDGSLEDDFSLSQGPGRSTSATPPRRGEPPRWPSDACWPSRPWIVWAGKSAELGSPGRSAKGSTGSRPSFAREPPSVEECEVSRSEEA